MIRPRGGPSVRAISGRTQHRVVVMARAAPRRRRHVAAERSVAGPGRRRRRTVPTAAAVSPNCGTEPVELLAYFETGFPSSRPSPTSSPSSSRTSPGTSARTSSRNLMTQTPRLLSGDNPPDLIRLPSMVDLVQDGLLLNLDAVRRPPSAGTSGRPPCSRQHRVAEDGRPAARARPVRDAASTTALTGVFYNKELAAQIGMTEPPATLAEFEDAAREGQGRPASLPIMQWNAADSGGGLAFPLQNLMAALRPRRPRSTTGSSRRRARRSTRPPTWRPPQHLAAVDRGRLLPRGRQRHRVRRRELRASRRARASSPSTVTGRTAAYDTDAAGQRRLLPVPAGRGRWRARLRCRRPLTFGIAANAKNADCAAFFLNWVAHERRPRARSTSTVGGSNPGRARRTCRCPPVAGRLGHERDARRRRRSPQPRTARWTSSPTRPARSSPQGWTPELQKMVGGQQTPPGCLQAVQAEYEEELAQ